MWPVQQWHFFASATCSSRLGKFSQRKALLGCVGAPSTRTSTELLTENGGWAHRRARQSSDSTMEHRSSEYRRLNKRQKQARWQQFNESQASKSAQLQDLARLRGAPSKKLSLRKHSFWSMNTMQTMLTPPPILASPPTEPPLPVSIPPAEPPAEPPPSISIPPVEPPAQPPKLTWRPPEDWRVTDSLLDLGIRGGSGIRRPIDEERAAAAGVDLKGMHWSGRSKALRRRERSEEKSQVEKTRRTTLGNH